MRRSRAFPSSRCLPWLWALAVVIPSGCDDSRAEAMKREVEMEKGAPKPKEELPPDIPPHPMRDTLMPVLEKIYALNQPPPVMEADLETETTDKYEITPGVLSVIRVQSGTGDADKIRAIVMGTAEADAWAYRPDARREYADQIHRVHRGFGDDQKALVLKAYAHLRLLQFFNSEDAGPAIEKLDESVRPTVEAMRKHYVEDKQQVWEEWMGVKMYARRVVAGDEPFRTVLRGIKKELGKEEPPPRTWDEAMTTPQFKEWGKQIVENEELVTKLLNMRELREREEFLNDTHSLWAIEGSPEIPAKAKKLRPDPGMGFVAMREDLGGGYNDMTYIFSKSLSGEALKKAYLRSIIYGQLLHDFGMLATAGSDFATRTEDNVIDSRTAVVPDKYDPLYAKCGSAAAVETFITHYRDKFPILNGMGANGDSEAVLGAAHKCVIEGAAGDIHVPAKGDDKDTEGPAPGSRLAIYQMLARFENVDVNMARMANDVTTPEDEEIDEMEAKLRAIREKENEGKGIK
jgi:hypothetical protein